MAIEGDPLALRVCSAQFRACAEWAGQRASDVTSLRHDLRSLGGDNQWTAMLGAALDEQVAIIRRLEAAAQSVCEVLLDLATQIEDLQDSDAKWHQSGREDPLRRLVLSPYGDEATVHRVRAKDRVEAEWPPGTAEALSHDAGSDKKHGLWGSIGHGALDVVGLVPILGEPADGVNALWYAAEGDRTNAALSAAGMIPGLGWGATGAKLGIKGVKAADEAIAGTGQAARGINALSDARTGATAAAAPAQFGASTTNAYRATWTAAHPETADQVVVHHAVEKQVQTRYPGLVSDSELHSLENLRGIPKGDVNHEVHLSAIRKEWNRFYRANPNPTKQDLLDMATSVDDKYGGQFLPPIR